MAREATVVVLVLALGGTSWWLGRSTPAEAAPPTTTAEPVPATTPTTDTAPAAKAPVPAVAPAAAAKPDRRDQLELPDGSFVAALNGATNPEPLGKYWGNWPWSPIVGVERSSAGVDWYKHADGSYSTTEVKIAQPGNRSIVLTRVAHPTEQTAPTAPEARR